jgi:HK97 family phage major capsid protein
MGYGDSTAGGFNLAAPLVLAPVQLALNKMRVREAGAVMVPVDRLQVDIAVVKSNPTAEWHGENSQLTASDAAFGQVTMIQRPVAVLCKQSIELVEDAPNFAQLIEQAVGDSIALEADRGMLRGKGVSNEIPGVGCWPGIQTIDMGTNGAVLDGYDEMSRAYTKIQNVNGPSDGIGVLAAPRTLGDIDRFKDGDGQPLRGPESWQLMKKYPTNQIPTNLVHGNTSDNSEVYVADWSSLLITMRTQLTIEISRVAADGSGSAFSNMQIWIRAYLRMSSALLRPERFVLISGVRSL